MCEALPALPPLPHRNTWRPLRQHAQILGEQDHRRPIKSEQDIAETLGVALEVFRRGFDSGNAERFLHDSIPGAVRGLAATKPLMPITIAQRRASQALP